MRIRVYVLFLGNGDGDLDKAHMLVEHYLKINPDVSISFLSKFFVLSIQSIISER